MKDDNIRSSNIDILSTFALTVSTAPTREHACRAAELATSKLIGHSLFTVMAFDSNLMEVERFYTSGPKNYPAGGRKKKRDTNWGRHVLLEGQVFIGSSDEDIRRNFDDHQVIADLGLCAVINIPIKRMGTTIGTMNLLDTSAHYDEKDARSGAIVAMGLATILP